MNYIRRSGLPELENIIEVADSVDETKSNEKKSSIHPDVYVISSAAAAVIIAGMLLNIDGEVKKRAKEQMNLFLDITGTLLSVYAKAASRAISSKITQRDRKETVEEQWESVESARNSR